jgi:hypothetical protein
MIALAALLALLPAAAVAPVLEFPEPGLDDPAAYQEYRTRVFRDARGNPIQVCLDGRSGRVVMVMADAANASVGFTVRDSAGPVPLAWGSGTAAVTADGDRRAVTWRLRLPGRPLDLGHFALGSMRWERDLVYQGRHLAPLDSALPPVPEMADLVRRLARLEPGERERHLEALGAPSVEALRARLRPAVSLAPGETTWTARIEQPSLDGRTHLALELRGTRTVEGGRSGEVVLLRPRAPGDWSLEVRVETDAGSLTPLDRAAIFNRDFLAFLARARRRGPSSPAFRRLERGVRGMEVLCHGEKLMAGLPNFATYFGRDMMMTALMMEPVWAPAMLEHVLGSVLGKVSDQGEVSHEEALGGQAIREHAAEYVALLEAAERAPGPSRDSLLALARDLLGHLQAVRENYQMLDDDLQLPVVAGRYLARRDLPAARTRAFLLAPARGEGSPPRLELLLRNFARVAAAATPYARAPEAAHLVGFSARPEGGFSPGSWRDSQAGYAGGRYALDINVVWVPEALRGIATSLAALRALGLPVDSLVSRIGDAAELGAWLSDAGALARDRATWLGAARHFEVRIAAGELRERLAAWLAWLPAGERAHWQAVADTVRLAGDTLRFLALSLDEAGRPILVVNTDPATLLFLADLEPSRAEEAIRAIMLPYPVGLFVPRLGPLVANDVCASREVWETFNRDAYHSPRVVWGREVNLLLLGLARQIHAAGEGSTAGRRLRAAQHRIRAAVEASGLEHAELWSYRIEGDALRPVRYGTGSDVQLWNLTDLAVEFTLARMPGR